MVDSKDKEFIDYYVGYEQFNTYEQANDKLESLKIKHALGRFDQ